MKKTLILLIGLVAIMSLTGCIENVEVTVDETPNDPPDQGEADTQNPTSSDAALQDAADTEVLDSLENLEAEAEEDPDIDPEVERQINELQNRVSELESENQFDELDDIEVQEPSSELDTEEIEAELDRIEEDIDEDFNSDLEKNHGGFENPADDDPSTDEIAEDIEEIGEEDPIDEDELDGIGEVEEPEMEEDPIDEDELDGIGEVEEPDIETDPQSPFAGEDPLEDIDPDG